MAAEMQTTLLRVKSAQTKPMRLILVSRSSRLKPRPLLKCVRTISPSSTSTLRPRSFRRFSMISERVLFPAPESPVNQIVNPVFATNSFSSYALYALFQLKCFPLHISGNRNPKLFQDCRGHIHQL